MYKNILRKEDVLMLMTEGTRDKLNEVLTHSFLLNMICDNAVYQIDYSVYPVTAHIVHESYAHYWPQVADKWSDLMIKLNAKPVRGDLHANYEDYDGNLSAIFADIARATEDYRRKIVELIELAELNEDKEVVLMGEEILLQIMPYRKQADIWATESKRYEGNYKSFDTRIETFTTMIPIVE